MSPYELTEGPYRMSKSLAEHKAWEYKEKLEVAANETHSSIKESKKKKETIVKGKRLESSSL